MHAADPAALFGVQRISPVGREGVGRGAQDGDGERRAGGEDARGDEQRASRAAVETQAIAPQQAVAPGGEPFVPQAAALAHGQLGQPARPFAGRAQHQLARRVAGEVAKVECVGGGVGGGGLGAAQWPRRLFEAEGVVAPGIELNLAELAAHHGADFFLHAGREAVEQGQAQPVRHVLATQPGQHGQARVVVGDVVGQVFGPQFGVEVVLLAEQQGQLPAHDGRYGAGA